MRDAHAMVQPKQRRSRLAQLLHRFGRLSNRGTSRKRSFIPKQGGDIWGPRWCKSSRSLPLFPNRG